MKANRKFVNADEAVSPVIAVILMVAITVVLAATVFVLVSDIGGNTANAAPTFSMRPDEGSGKLSVQSAAANADWNRLQILISSCSGGAATNTVMVGGATANTHVNQAAQTATGGKTKLVDGAGCTTPIATPERPAGSAMKMTANDYIQFCGATPAPTNVKVDLRDTTANTIAYTYTFTTIPVCTP